ncbi:MAG TPA: cupredoxin domain-containing protein [Patescibacteria group bacterium]
MQIIGLILIIIVIGLYFFWLYFTKTQKGAMAVEKKGIQTFNILVKGVYSPNIIRTRVNQPVKINFRREESTDCSRYVNFPDFKIRRELPENKTVAIEFTPERKGEFVFTCDMSMYQGKLIVE